MTENLAARGEGLAGLGERKRLARRLILAIAKEAVELAIVRSELTWDEAADITEEQIAKDAALAIFGAGTCDDQPTENVQKLLAALEAAAPPSTAHNELSLVRLVLSAHQTAFAKFHNGEGRGVIEADQMAIGYASVELAKALATPSPQAPPEQCNAFSTTSAREQSSATASNSPSVALFPDRCERCRAGMPRVYMNLDMPHPYGGLGWWHWSENAVWAQGGKSGAWFTCEVQSTPPAATQEQPAGSGANLKTGDEVWVRGQFRDVLANETYSVLVYAQEPNSGMVNHVDSRNVVADMGRGRARRQEVSI